MKEEEEGEKEHRDYEQQTSRWIIDHKTVEVSCMTAPLHPNTAKLKKGGILSNTTNHSHLLLFSKSET